MQQSNTWIEATRSICSKWQKQQQFTRFLDGDVSNGADDNRLTVSLSDALQHIGDWKVDWDFHLTNEEIALVQNSEWRAGLQIGK